MTTPSTQLQMPAPESSGFVKTVNGMGYMTTSIDPISQQFIARCHAVKGNHLEIGAAYGNTALRALNQGSMLYVNDIDQRHLDIFARSVPEGLQENFRLLPGKFPSELNIPEHSLASVLIARVLHFFDGHELEHAAQQVRRWLQPGGKLYIVCETPYLKNFTAFIPVYEARRKAQDPWPGRIDNVQAFAPDRGKALPTFMHFLDPDVLQRVFSQAGFCTEQATLLARTDFPQDLQLDGRESVGYVGYTRSEVF